MAAGRVGVDGILVVNPVELVFENVLVVARGLCLVMAGKLAKEQRGNVKTAIPIRVLVRHTGPL